MRKILSSMFAVAIVASATVWATEPNLEGVKCVVAPKAASADKSAEYKEGHVYFCCGGCASKFAANTEKFAPKANHQLVSTKQYEQKACPFSGQPVAADKSVKVAGVEVGFCCGNCVKKAAGEEGDKQIAMVFGDKTFVKGFQVKKEKPAVQ